MEAATTMGMERDSNMQVHAGVAGEVAVRVTAGSERGSSMQALAMACKGVSAGDVPAVSAGNAGKALAVSALAHEEGVMSSTGMGAVVETLGTGAAGCVARSAPAAAHVQGHLVQTDDGHGHPRVAATHEIESAAHVQAGLALSHGHDGAALVHVCAAPVRDYTVHVGVDHVHPSLSSLNGQDSAAHVLPCMAPRSFW
ncbi:hypothetical protein ACOSP7_012329 [Xanthoceras sorbifolium]